MMYKSKIYYLLATLLIFAGVFLFSFVSPKKNNKTLLSQGFKKLCDSPLVYVCDHFLSDEECNYLIELARPDLNRTTVVDPNSPTSMIDSRRTSLGTFLSATPQEEVVKRIHKRIAKVTEIPEKNGEGMQILYYGVGAEYQPHFDYFDPDTTGGLTHFNRGGQRVATFIVYLNTPEAGGETIFPKANTKVVPMKGRAVLFYNVNAENKPDPMSFHGGAPVVKGEKWLITRWLREGEFH